MGHTVIPAYRIEVNHPSFPWTKPFSVTPMAWDMAWGEPSAENLEKFMMTYGKSFEVGGANEHFSHDLGHIPYPDQGKVVRQADGEVVATWEAPMFMVW